jgi:hypothetical protein
MRALGIVLRTAHIAAMAILVGGYWFAVSDPALRTWRVLTVATGIALLASEVSHSRHWVYQGRGVFVVAHVAALGLVAASGSLGRYGLAAAIALGSVGSHLPRTVRKWSFRHRRVMD